MTGSDGGPGVTRAGSDAGPGVTGALGRAPCPEGAQIRGRWGLGGGRAAGLVSSSWARMRRAGEWGWL